MTGSRPSEAMKILIRRLGNGKTVRFLGMDKRRAAGLRRRYCFVPGMTTANTNLVDGAIARGYLERNRDGEYTLSPSGRAIYANMNGDFERWEITVSGSETPIGGFAWRCTCVPAGKDGTVSKLTRAARYLENRRYNTLDALVSAVVRDLKSAGFASDQIVFCPMTQETADMDRRQRDLIGQRRKAIELEQAEYIEMQKREANMTVDHVLMTPVSSLDISTRSANCLKEAGVTVIGELVAMSEADVMAMKNAGRKTLNDLKEAMAMFDVNLLLGSGLPDWQVEEIARLKGDEPQERNPRRP